MKYSLGGVIVGALAGWFIAGVVLPIIIHSQTPEPEPTIFDPIPRGNGGIEVIDLGNGRVSITLRVMSGTIKNHTGWATTSPVQMEEALREAIKSGVIPKIKPQPDGRFLPEHATWCGTQVIWFHADTTR